MPMIIFGSFDGKIASARGCSEVGYRVSLSRRRPRVRIPSASHSCHYAFPTLLLNSLSEHATN